MKTSKLQVLSVGMAALMLLCMFFALPLNAHAANGTVVKTTNMQCSIWSAPNTAAANKIKSVEAGYKITVYPDVVKSTAGDGKTFYKTVKGAYILCKCVDGSAPSVTNPVSGTIEKVAEYSLHKKYSSYTYHYIIVKNNTTSTKTIQSSTYAYDPTGNLLGYSDDKIDVLAPGATSILVEYFSNVSGPVVFNTTLSYSTPKYYKAVTQNLTYAITPTNKGAVAQITNLGTIPARFTQGYLLCFKNGQLVDCDFHYFTDDNSEIKPGATIAEQYSYLEEYDSLEFYMIGRGPLNY